MGIKLPASSTAASNTVNYLDFPSQDPSPAEPTTAGLRLYCNGDDAIELQNHEGETVIIYLPGHGGDSYYSLPMQSGTIALAEDLYVSTDGTVNGALTFPPVGSLPPPPEGFRVWSNYQSTAIGFQSLNDVTAFLYLGNLTNNREYLFPDRDGTIALAEDQWDPQSSEYVTSKNFGSDNGDYSTFEEDGTLVAYGAAQTWEDVNIGGLALLGSASKAPDIVTAVATPGIRLYSFDGATAEEELSGIIELPHSYAEGSDVYAHIHWMNSTTNSGVVRWKIQYAWINPGEPMAATNTLFLDQAVNQSELQHSHVVSAFVDGSGRLISSHFIFRLYRTPTDAADSYPDKAYLIAVGLHFPVNTLGSREVGTK